MTSCTRATVLALTLLTGAVGGCGRDTADQDASTTAPSPPSQSSRACPSPSSDTSGEPTYAGDDVDGVDAVDCDLVGATVDVGGVVLTVPEPGRGVGGAVAGAESDRSSDTAGGVGGQLTTDTDGIISVER